MPEVPDKVALPALIALGAGLLVWYLGGNEVMRRRAHRLAVWSKRGIDPLGGRQSVQWLTQQAFRLQVEAPRVAGMKAVTLTGLVESWDVPMVWLWNRLHGRRDMVVLSLTLRDQPVWGFEVFRPKSILAGDARHLARQEGWVEQPLGPDLVLAAGGDGPRHLATSLVDALDGDERGRLVRLAVRRQGASLSLALNVPNPTSLDPARLGRLAQRLAEQAQARERRT